MIWGKSGADRTPTNYPADDPSERLVAAIYYLPTADGFKFVLQEHGAGTSRLIQQDAREHVHDLLEQLADHLRGSQC